MKRYLSEKQRQLQFYLCNASHGRWEGVPLLGNHCHGKLVECRPSCKPWARSLNHSKAAARTYGTGSRASFSQG